MGVVRDQSLVIHWIPDKRVLELIYLIFTYVFLKIGRICSSGNISRKSKISNISSLSIILRIPYIIFLYCTLAIHQIFAFTSLPRSTATKSWFSSTCVWNSLTCPAYRSWVRSRSSLQLLQTIVITSLRCCSVLKIALRTCCESWVMLNCGGF